MTALVPKTQDAYALAPEKDKTRILETIRSTLALGASTQEVSRVLGIGHTTFNRWSERHPEVEQAIIDGQTEADAKVSKALFSRAVGYTYSEQRPMQIEGELVVADYEKHMAPDVNAGIFWLTNRRSDVWQDVRRVSATVSHEVGDGLAELLRQIDGSSRTIDVTPEDVTPDDTKDLLE